MTFKWLFWFFAPCLQISFIASTPLILPKKTTHTSLSRRADNMKRMLQLVVICCALLAVTCSGQASFPGKLGNNLLSLTWSHFEVKGICPKGSVIPNHCVLGNSLHWSENDLIHQNNVYVHLSMSLADTIISSLTWWYMYCPCIRARKGSQFLEILGPADFDQRSDAAATKQ